MKRAWLLLLLSATAAAQELPAESFQRRKVVTQDGAALALYRYVPAGGGAQSPALLLVPDLAFSKEAYDFDGGGLARHFQKKGRDTFVIELRGQGRSSAPRDWSLLDWVEKDLPAAVAAVQAAHPGPVDVVVQGYGGSLVLAASTKELKGQLERVIAINTPAIMEMPNALLRQTLQRGGRFSQLSRAEFDLLFARDGVFATGLVGEFRGVGVGDLSAKAAAELSAWLDGRPLRFSDGTTFDERLRAYDRPTLLVLPLLDNFSHPEHASALRDVAKGAKIRVQGVSKFPVGSEDYTHLSVLLGKNAETEVHEAFGVFLNAEVAR